MRSVILCNKRTCMYVCYYYITWITTVICTEMQLICKQTVGCMRLCNTSTTEFGCSLDVALICCTAAVWFTAPSNTICFLYSRPVRINMYSEDRTYSVFLLEMHWSLYVNTKIWPINIDSIYTRHVKMSTQVRCAWDNEQCNSFNFKISTTISIQ